MELLHLENEWLRATVLPDVGAKIYDLVWKPSGRNYLWHNPRIQPHPYPVDANFDNHWCGGWDDAFPTCDPCEFRGERYPGLGELRSLRWDVEAGADEREVKLSAWGPINPVRAHKTVTLAGGTLRMRFDLTNVGPKAIDFIWGTHPAVGLFGETILRIPGKTGILSEGSPLYGKPGRRYERYEWPKLGEIDVSRNRDWSEGVYCGTYVTDLEEGWYAVEDARTGEGLLVRFPLDICPHLWLWLSYGGYRGHNLVIVEPWTSIPVTLSGAFEKGTHRVLNSGGVFSAEIVMTPYQKPETWRDALESAACALEQIVRARRDTQSRMPCPWTRIRRRGVAQTASGGDPPKCLSPGQCYCCPRASLED